MSRLELPGLLQLQAERGKKLRKCRKLLFRWLVVHTIDQGCAFSFQLLRRGHIRCDHKLLDQTMSVKPGRGNDAAHTPPSIELDLALRQIEIERRAAGACPSEAAIGAPYRP